MRGLIRAGNYVFDAYDVEVTPHGADYDFFESYEGIIGIRKQLDKFEQVKFKVLITERMLENFGKKVDSDGFADPELYRDDFVKLRKEFLNEIDGQVVVCASEMFPVFKAIMSARTYKIEAGETEAVFDIEMREVI